MHHFKKSTLTVAAIALLYAAQSGSVFSQEKKKAKARGGATEHVEQGMALAQAGKFEEAIVEFTKVIEADPKNPRNYNNRGTAYRSAGKFPEALADFSKAIELAPKDAMGYFERGQTNVIQNQFDAALPDLDKAIELKPDLVAAYKFRGFAQIGRSDFDKAIADFDKAIEKIQTMPSSLSAAASQNAA